ncbi:MULTISPECIES: M23 family metallopeptidase [unclassified Micromonospora]|uniref:M23 family metallopeptidase n=1 Tax=unclassified Micromonospora TaxID=2617518 RepID=UPI00241639EB|nr:MULTISPECIES: M23 family metallopeptidase [unclassified Micromonospora]MDG4817000.1 M23 family metallopeptidase [Micromonospora sp. WMMD956]WFE59577.1 M23 family metallopeptidase [Micromonospora sp. WMMD712]
MTLRALVSLAVAVVAVVILCAGGLGGVLGGGSAAGCIPVSVSPAAAPSTLPPASAPPTAWPASGDWDSDQVGNAATIVTTGARLALPARGWVVAVATAMQESTLRNLSGGDRDSVGLFQQRPSQGWGTPAQLQDPVYASDKFYRKLVAVGGWQAMPLTEAAQAVQVSAYPDAYAKWEGPATRLVTAIADTTGLPTDGLAGCGAAGPWTQPVLAPVGSGFRSADRPGHDGVDLSAPRGTLIRAASAGTVRTVRCDAVHADTGAEWGCDRDGDPVLTRGCGWYVDIDHPGGLLTRYCHMDQPPMVTLGQPVAAGQPIGLVGSTGHSSGPHLHYEVHHHADAGPNGAIDPVPFMAAQNAPLRTRP